jgi:hypothetical protein
VIVSYQDIHRCVRLQSRNFDLNPIYPG